MNEEQIKDVEVLKKYGITPSILEDIRKGNFSICPKKGSAKAIVSLVLSILSFLTLAFGIISPICSIISIILGAQSYKKGRKMGLAGLIIGIISLVIAIIIIVGYIFYELD